MTLTDQPPKPCPLCRAEPFVGELSDYQFAACSDGDCPLGKTHFILEDWNELLRLSDDDLIALGFDPARLGAL